MKLLVLPVSEITIPKNRQRRIFNENLIQELAASIADNGLLHPVIIRRQDSENILVAGERRLRALELVWGFGQPVRCGGHIIPEQQVPVLNLGDIDPVDAFEAELEENVRRTDISWQERCQATAQLFELRRLQDARDGTPTRSSIAVARDILGIDSATPNSEVTSQLAGVRDELILARELDDQDIAKAPSKSEALKILKRKNENRLNAELGARVDTVQLAAQHQLIAGDCIEWLSKTNERFDIILTDPPYGINAQDFGDGGGHQPGGGHAYNDSPASFRALITRFAILSTQVTKPNAHLYLFCDIDHFLFLRDTFADSGWNVFRTPLVWVNPTANKAPWPQRGPMRKYQLVLFATRGDRNVTVLAPDVLTYPSEPNLAYHAQKPVALYSELLRRSAHPSDHILDPFCGTGTIFPSAHAAKCIATGIDSNPIALAIATRRLKELT